MCRVNYHVSPNPGVNFIPCLLDLTEAVPFVAYVIPAVTLLDLAGDMRSGDHFIELDDGSVGALGFEFFVLPFSVSPLLGEIWRFIVEGRYGLACVLVSGALFPIRPGVPTESFSVIRPSSLLPTQSIPEEQAFIRFQELMHENQVRQPLMSSEIPEHTHNQIVEEIVMVGRGIQGPNNEGVWEVVCNVPIRICPALTVQFLDPRYRAEMIDVTSTDKRQEKVRIRFKVFDQQAKTWVKHPVEILKAFLDAEL